MKPSSPIEKFKFTITDNTLMVSFDFGIEKTTIQAKDFKTSDFALSRQFLKELTTFKNILNKFHGKELLFYGGTFNPFHDGHLECIKQAANKFSESIVVVMPDNNPLKLKDDKREHFPHEMYFSLLDKLNDLNLANVELFPGFLALDIPNPTIDWLKNISRPCSLIIGDDNLFIFDKWKDYQEIFKIIERLIIVPRNFELKEIEQKANDFKVSQGLRDFIILNSHEYQNISSTKIRQDKN